MKNNSKIKTSLDKNKNRQTQNSNSKISFGFTLIEMIATVSIFIIVVSIATGTLITIIKTQRRNNAQRTIQQEAKNVLETITREAKLVSGSDSYPPFTVGNNPPCHTIPPYDPSGEPDGLENAYTYGNQVMLTNGPNDVKTYFLDKDETEDYEIVKITEELDSANPTRPDLTKAHDITSENVNVTELKFEISPKSVALPPVPPETESEPEVQPFVKITLSLESRKDLPATRAKTTIKTTVSSLKYTYKYSQAVPPPPIPEEPPAPSSGWAKAYGGGDTEISEISSAQQTSDGGYIIAGDSRSFGAGDYDILLIKIDSDGNQIWAKTYRGEVDDYVSFVQQTSDGGYIISGHTSSFGTGSYDFLLIKTDSSGNQTWAKTYGGAFAEYSRSAQQTSDGGYIITGRVSVPGGYDVLLIKTDSSGNQTWAKTYGGAAGDNGVSVQQTSDGGYIVGAETGSFGAGGLGYDFLLIKTDSSGNQTWAKTYGGADYEDVYSAQQTSDGGYIISGQTESFGAGDYDFLVVKTDSSGNLTWVKTYGALGNDYHAVIQQTSDGGYIIAGDTTITSPPSSFGYNTLLIKTNSSGDMTWAKLFGGSDWEDTDFIKQKFDGYYIFGGFTQSFGVNRDIFVVSVDNSGSIGSCDELNDVTSQVNVQSPSPTETSPSVTVTDICVESPPPPEGTNVALALNGGQIINYSHQEPNGPASALIDGQIAFNADNQTWMVANPSGTEYATIGFDNTYTINQINHYNDGEYGANSVTISYSIDSINWGPIGTYSLTTTPSTPNKDTILPSESVQARYLRFEYDSFNNSSWFQVNEIEAFSPP